LLTIIVAAFLTYTAELATNSFQTKNALYMRIIKEPEDKMNYPTSGSRLGMFFFRYRHFILIACTLSFILPEISVYFSRPARGGDMHTYVKAGLNFIAKEDLYRESRPSHGNTWPPFFSLFIVPLSITAHHLSMPAAKETWYFFTFFCFIATVVLWSKLLLKTRVRFLSLKGDPDFTSRYVFIPILTILPALVNNFFNLQINTVILFILSLGLYYHRENRPGVSGILFGLAASIKAYPGLFLIYFLFRKQWKLSIFIIIAGIFFTISPVFFYGFEGFYDLFRKWFSMSFSSEFGVGCGKYTNQSLYALWTYYLSCLSGLFPLAHPAIKKITYISIIILISAVFTLLCRKPFNKRAESSLIEFSIVCLLMTLFSPIAWRHYWVNAFPAAMITIFHWNKSGMVFRFFTVAWIALLSLSYVTSGHIQKTILSLGAYTWTAVFLICSMLILYVMDQSVIAQDNAKEQGVQ